MNILAGCLAAVLIIQANLKQMAHVQCRSIGGVAQAQAQAQIQINGNNGEMSEHKAQQIRIDKTFQGEGGKVKETNQKINDGSSGFVRTMQMKNRSPNKAIITTNNKMRNRQQGIVLAGRGFGREKNILPLFPEYPEELALIHSQPLSPTTLSSLDLSDTKLATTNDGKSVEQNKLVQDRQSEFANQNKCLEEDNKDYESLPKEINYLNALPENKRKSGKFSRSNEDRLSSKSIDLDLRLAFRLPEGISGL